MDSIKRLVGGLLGGKEQHGRGNGNAQPVLEVGEHREHWGCVLRSQDEGVLVEALAALLSSRNGEDGVRLVCLGSGPLRLCAVVDRERVLSAYPEAEGEHVWPLVLSGVEPQNNGLEALVTGSVNGLPVTLFDTRYSLNAGRYTVGESYNFAVSAFAYTLEKAAEREAESEIGASVSFKGAHALMPAVSSNELAGADDYWFHSPLEGDTHMEVLLGKYLRGYPVTVALPGDFPMSLTVYAAGHTSSPEVARIEAGDDLEGFIWLQGYLHDGEAPTLIGAAGE